VDIIQKEYMKKISLVWIILIFTSGNLMAQEQDSIVIQGSNQANGEKTSFGNKWSLGIGYSGGLWYSRALGRYFHGSPIALFQPIPWDWLSSASGYLSYKTSSKWTVCLGVECFSFKLEDREAPSVWDSLGLILTGKTNWKVYGGPIIVSVNKQLKKNSYLTFGVEYYFSYGESENLVQYSHHYPTLDTLTLYTKHWERGPGIFFGLGRQIELTHRIGLDVATVLNITNIEEYKYDIQYPLKWAQKTNFSFGGLFIKGALIFKL
jgi:hypothetical protein